MSEIIMNKRIMVVGDIMLDTYRFGEVSRISPEAPVPVFLEKDRIKLSPGGAANVAINVAAIGVPVDVLSVVGDDEAGVSLVRLLNDAGINTDCILTIAERCTTHKIRYIAQNNQQIMRSDKEDSTEVFVDVCEKVLNRLERDIDKYGLILLSDYKKGLLSYDLTQRIIGIAKKNKVPVYIDVKDPNTEKYRGATLLKPNRKELSDLSGMSVKTIDEAENAAIHLCNIAECNYVLTTLGADGMLLVNRNQVLKKIESVAREVYDVTGAGDTSLAYLAAEIVMGHDLEYAMEISNVAAGIQVGKVGTSVVYPEEVRAELSKQKSIGSRIVFTNGCFDILHAGHVSYLKKAKELGDRLVVGINSDESVRRLKGNGRPINKLEDRIAVLSALDCVDEVIPFEEDTPLELIKRVHPDVLVKGNDYTVENIVGADFVLSYGGDVKTIPLLQGRSTTGIAKRMRGE